MSKKKWILAIAAVLLLAAVVLGAWLITRPQTTDGQKTFTVTVVHGDGTSKDFSYTTVEEYVGVCLEKEGLIIGEEGPYGLFVLEVDGEEAVYEEDGAYWGFFVGEDYAQTGIDLTPITDGGVYQLVYTIG